MYTEDTMQEIKYHKRDCNTDSKKNYNWDANKVYGDNEYVNVHFRIETYGYEYPTFILSTENKEKFNKEIAEVFTSLGWKSIANAHNGICAEWGKEKSHLYCHPLELSGEVKKNEIKKIAEAMQKRNTFSLKWVDLYDTIYDMTYTDYHEYLDNKSPEIKDTIFEKCQTRVKNRYYYADEICKYITNIYALQLLEKDSRSITKNHVVKLMNEMKHDGYLVIIKDSDGDICVRCTTKGEQEQITKKKNMIW